MDAPFSVVDAVVIIFTVLSAILAMARGITREVLGVASFVAAGFIATYSADFFAPMVTSAINLKPLAEKFSGNPETIAIWISGVVLFIFLWIIFTVITAKLSRFISDSAVSGIDSTLGFIFGVGRGLFIVGIAYNMYTHFVPPEKYHETVVNARLKPILDETSDVIVGLASLLLPERVADGFSKRQEVNYDNDVSTQENVNDIIGKSNSSSSYDKISDVINLQ